MSQGSSHPKELGRDKQRIAAWAIIPMLILLVPFIAMQVTDEVQWDVADFVFAGVLLATAGIIYALLTPKSKTAIFHSAIGLVIIIVVVLIWIEFAVGIFS
jgi:hypothetical protein